MNAENSRTNNDATGDPAHECREIYDSICRQTWESGIDESKVLESKDKFAVSEGREYFVKREAAKPTGVALGHPLPERVFADQLWRLCHDVEHRLATLGDTPTFAFVPASGYHITLASRSHFDNGPVFDMNAEETEAARHTITQVKVGAITVDFMGLVLSRDGRLLVRGFPTDNRIAELRRALAIGVPTLRRPFPKLVHVKLGHFLTCPPLPQLREVMSWLDTLSNDLRARIVFEDVYTPRERIAL